MILACHMLTGVACGSSDAGTPTNGGQDGGDTGAAEDGGGSSRDAGGNDAPPSADSGMDGGANDASMPVIPRGCPAGSTGCFTVYAHTDHALYVLNLATSSLESVGPFNAPIPDGGVAEDVITDLAVTPDDKLWVISATQLYNADPATGHVSVVGGLAACGQGNVALTSNLAGKLYLGDNKGAICSLDPATHPPTVGPIETLGGGYALTGDIVVVSDGTAYATGYNLAAPATLTSNLLLTLDLTNPAAPQSIGPTGYPRLFGVAFGLGKVLAFTHDGSGRVASIDPATGIGSPFGTFQDSVTQQPIQFGGAGVNPRVSKSGR